MKRLIPILLMCCLLLAACDSNRVYQQVYDFDEEGWHMDSIPEFTFDIADTEVKNLILHLRNSIAFEWQNIYLTYYLEDSTGRQLSSELINIELFDPKTGEPKGQGSSIYQHAVQLLKDYQFPGKGSYTLRIAQYMRTSALKEVLSVGLRVEQSSN